ncbi:MAG: ACT domain-containing protein, partial [Lachnospiraceae bacterium]|nr:ACT domain-containing protein [Lachnospiraceae bacterium]
MKQLSVFLENREGRLSDVLRILAENNINILSL